MSRLGVPHKSGEGTARRADESSSARALQFAPSEEAEGSLITSSVRKPKKGSKVESSPKKRQTSHRDSEEPSCATPDFPSPELKKRKKQSDQEVKQPEGTPVPCERAAADEAETASPPRPSPELPPGVPAPPIPQGRVPQAGVDRDPHGGKPKGVLQTIFSPMFQLFQPGEDASGEDGAGDENPADRQGTSPDRVRGSKSRSPERRPPSKSLERGLETSRLQPDDPEALESGKGGRVATCRPTASDGASSTDGESETCLGSQQPPLRQARDLEESDADSEAGEEVYTTDSGNDLEDDSLEFDPYAFIKSLPPLDQCAPAWRRCLLPKQTRQCKRKTLVLDLDETLVHSTLDGDVLTDFRFEVFFNNRTHSVSVRQRPHLSAFLERCADLFEVVVFTASQKLYAEQLLNILDPQRKFIRHRIFRDDCLLVEGNYLKDLTVLGRDLAHTIIVDNSPQAFGFQLANGVPIESWYDDESDTELIRLLPFLESLVEVPDVRPLIVNAFKLQQLVDDAPHY